MTEWTRRDMLYGLSRLPLLAGFSALVTACGGDDGTKKKDSTAAAGGGSTTPTSTCSDSISLNHGHTACIPQSVLDSPQPTNIITLTTGNAHTHTITLTAAEVTQIKSNTATVVKTSSNDSGHTHDVTYIA